MRRNTHRTRAQSRRKTRTVFPERLTVGTVLAYYLAVALGIVTVLSPIVGVTLIVGVAAIVALCRSDLTIPKGVPPDDTTGATSDGNSPAPSAGRS